MFYRQDYIILRCFCKLVFFSIFPCHFSHILVCVCKFPHFLCERHAICIYFVVQNGNKQATRAKSYFNTTLMKVNPTPCTLFYQQNMLHSMGCLRRWSTNVTLLILWHRLQCLLDQRALLFGRGRLLPCFPIGYVTFPILSDTMSSTCIEATRLYIQFVSSVLSNVW